MASGIVARRAIPARRRSNPCLRQKSLTLVHGARRRVALNWLDPRTIFSNGSFSLRLAAYELGSASSIRDAPDQFQTADGLSISRRGLSCGWQGVLFSLLHLCCSIANVGPLMMKSL